MPFRSAKARDQRSLVVLLASLVALTLVGLLGLGFWLRAARRARELDDCARVTHLPLEGATLLEHADDAEMSTQAYLRVAPSALPDLRADLPEVPRPDPVARLPRSRHG